MCYKAVHTCPFAFDSVPDWYKTQEMCDKVVDDCLLALKFVPDWFVMKKMPEKVKNDDIDDMPILLKISLMMNKYCYIW